MARPEPDQVLEGLKAGNARSMKNVKDDAARHAKLALGQEPNVIVLACADSRVAPEIVFDVGLGEIFAVRVAGNVANTATIASIEYAVSVLGTRLIIVMAHQSCGAVAAALEGKDVSKNLNRLLSYIEPAVEACDDDEVDAVARHNAQNSADRLVEESEILRTAVEQDGLRIITAFHRFTTGQVEFD